MILLDIGLPGLSGYEVAERLRRRPEFAGTLLVAMTGWGQDEDRRRSREAGFDRHLVKPVDPDALRAILAHAAGSGADARRGEALGKGRVFRSDENQTGLEPRRATPTIEDGMSSLHPLLVNNQAWSSEKVRQDPEFFPSIAQQQNPDYLWIGCSDSRVPAEQLTGLEPGDLFVHRNVANVVIHTDLNCLSALQYAVDALKVEHVIVCGHYGCGGVLAALRNDKLGLIDNWLRHVQDVRVMHRDRLASLATEAERHEWLCELNVVEQAANVCRTTVVQDAWARGQELTVHGLIYGLKDGLLRDLGMRVSSPEELDARREEALVATTTVSSDERPDDLSHLS